MSGDLSDVARLTRVSKQLGGRNVLADLDLAIRAGEVTALLGPNGAGKTTSVSLLTGRIAPDAGTAELFGLDPRRTLFTDDSAANVDAAARLGLRTHLFRGTDGLRAALRELGVGVAPGTDG